MSYECLSWAIKQSVKGYAQSVLNVLAFHANPHWKCWPSYSLLASETGFSLKTIQRAILDLEELGIIFVQRNGYKNSNLYTINKSYPQVGDRSHRPDSSDDKSTESMVNMYESVVSQTIECGLTDLLIERNINKNINKRGRGPPKPRPLGEKKMRKVKSKSLGTSVSEDFVWGDKHRELVDRFRMNLDLEVELEKFKSYYLMNDKKCKDWSAAGRNWIMKAHEFQQRDSVKGSLNLKPRSKSQAFSEYSNSEDRGEISKRLGDFYDSIGM